MSKKRRKRYVRFEFNHDNTMEVRQQDATPEELIIAASVAIQTAIHSLGICEAPEGRIHMLGLIDHIISKGVMPTEKELEADIPAKNLINMVSSFINVEEETKNGGEAKS